MVCRKRHSVIRGQILFVCQHHGAGLADMRNQDHRKSENKAEREEQRQHPKEH